MRHIPRKLGLVSKEKDDDGLFESLFATMADTSADFTGDFRELSKACFSYSRFRIIRFRVKGSIFSKSMTATHDNRIALPNHNSPFCTLIRLIFCNYPNTLGGRLQVETLPHWRRLSQGSVPDPRQENKRGTGFQILY